MQPLHTLNHKSKPDIEKVIEKKTKIIIKSNPYN